jgi:polysaccharide export outer membrane protein
LACAFAVLALALGACRPANVDVLPPPAVDRTKVLGAGDELEITVAGKEELTGKFQVGDDGTIRFPWIGMIECAGKTPRDVAESIETKLADGWLRQPQVAVFVTGRQNREVSVLGQVKEPDSYPYKDGLTLVQAISLAGGMNPLAHAKKVKLTRETAAGRQTFTVDVTKILESRAQDLVLQPGDIVFVPESPI